jgi:hypothetical protein
METIKDTVAKIVERLSNLFQLAKIYCISFSVSNSLKKFFIVFPNDFTFLLFVEEEESMEFRLNMLSRSVFSGEPFMAT